MMIIFSFWLVSVVGPWLILVVGRYIGEVLMCNDGCLDPSLKSPVRVKMTPDLFSNYLQSPPLWETNNRQV